MHACASVILIYMCKLFIRGNAFLKHYVSLGMTSFFQPVLTCRSLAPGVGVIFSVYFGFISSSLSTFCERVVVVLSNMLTKQFSPFHVSALKTVGL